MTRIKKRTVIVSESFYKHMQRSQTQLGRRYGKRKLGQAELTEIWMRNKSFNVAKIRRRIG